MTHDETRDELARMDGWQQERVENDENGWPMFAWWKWNAHPTLKSRTWCRTHPHAPTLDGADAAVKSVDWWWERGCFDGHPDHWRAGRNGYTTQYVPDTGDEMADLYALALACRRAMEERK